MGGRGVEGLGVYGLDRARGHKPCTGGFAGCHAAVGFGLLFAFSSPLRELSECSVETLELKCRDTASTEVSEVLWGIR